MLRPPGLPSTFLDRFLRLRKVEVPAMEGLMQDYELTLQHVLWRLERLFPRKEVVTKAEQGVHRPLELYYAAPCMGAVLHTLNLRLFPQPLEFIIKDAEDKVLFVDQTLLPLLKPLLGKIPSVQTIVLMGNGTPR